MRTDNLPSIVKKVLAYRRKSRVKFILSKINITDRMNVIDIGCGADGRSFEDFTPQTWKITGIDIIPEFKIRHSHPGFSYVHQNAQDLSRFKDEEFDLAISIGMLEHITDNQTFSRVVSEIRRVAKQYVVLVPYRYCWIEPHFGIPFFPILPYSIKLDLVKALNLNDYREKIKEDSEYINKNYQWLSNSEYKSAFPDSSIYLLPTLEIIAITKRI